MCQRKNRLLSFASSAAHRRRIARRTFCSATWTRTRFLFWRGTCNTITRAEMKTALTLRALLISRSRTLSIDRKDGAVSRRRSSGHQPVSTSPETFFRKIPGDFTFPRRLSLDLCPLSLYSLLLTLSFGSPKVALPLPSSILIVSEGEREIS